MQQYRKMLVVPGMGSYTGCVITLCGEIYLSVCTYTCVALINLQTGRYKHLKYRGEYTIVIYAK